MTRYDPARQTRAGLILIGLLGFAMVAAFNLQKFPMVRGTPFHAEFSDASGIHPGARVEIAGTRVGRVNAVRIEGTKVLVDFDVKGGHRLGKDTTASINVLNLLGEKYLDLKPRGSGRLEGDSVIRLEKTTAGYDIVATLSQLTETTEELDTDQVAKALTTVADTLDEAAPEIQGSFEGVARLSQTIAANDEELDRLLAHAESVATTVADHKEDLTQLMEKSQIIFTELIRRRDDIHRLLVSARSLANQLSGVVKDNEKQIGPALRELRTATAFLNKREKELTDIVGYYDDYSGGLINIIGTGPWFDAYVPNLTGLVTGEFVYGRRPGLN
jgi:phospholipid/cholesterol/gamma-HCH transport system substrate-binding protein